MSRRVHRTSFAAKAGMKRGNATRALFGHDYPAQGGSGGGLSGVGYTHHEEEVSTSPLTPFKSPAVKRKQRGVEVSPSLLNEMYSQFASIKELINTRSDSLEQKITTLEDRIAHMSTDLNAINTKVIHLEQRVAVVEQPIKQIQKQVDDLEAHSRRMNLRIRGLAESEQENIHARVLKICQQVLPEADKDRLANNIDVVHRVGKRWPGNSRPRGVIMRFATRTWRDAVWVATKDNSYLKEHGLQFHQDFPKSILDRRAKLWPLVMKARSEHKKAYYVGGRAFIEGEGEITLSEE